MRLRYWGKIVRMGEDRIVKQIYKSSKKRLEREEEEQKRGERETCTETWCQYTRKLLRKLHLEEEWNTEEILPEDEWNALIRKRIHEREQVRWRTECLNKPKLRTYIQLKRELRTEPYLRVYSHRGLPELSKLRGGTNRLRIEQGRYKKEKLEDRVCVFCETKEVEDERHFMLKCAAYSDLRGIMWTELESEAGLKLDCLTSDESQLNVLIGDALQPGEEEERNSTKTLIYTGVVRVVMKFITTAMNRRRTLLGEVTPG